MKLISWNVNGLRAVMKKGFNEFFTASDADVFCIQETKLQEGQIEFNPPGYFGYWNYAFKKGYSGTAVFTRKQPMSVSFGMGLPEHDKEGRMVTIELDEFFLVNVYTPNSQRELARLDYRMRWEEDFRDYLVKTASRKPVVVCGDLNVAHTEIDLKNPSSNRRNAGFTDEERQKMTALLESGFTDSFRHLYPDREEAYTWWSYITRARERNAGWRIDYFLVSDNIAGEIDEASIFDEVTGSDHCPVGLVLKGGQS